MITGHLQEKNGRYYMVLNLKNENNKWKPKWIATGLLIKGNKKRLTRCFKTLLGSMKISKSSHNALLTTSYFQITCLTG